MLFTVSTDNICDTSGESANFYKATKQASKGTHFSSVNKRLQSISSLKKKKAKCGNQDRTVLSK